MGTTVNCVSAKITLTYKCALRDPEKELRKWWTRSSSGQASALRCVSGSLVLRCAPSSRSPGPTQSTAALAPPSATGCRALSTTRCATSEKHATDYLRSARDERRGSRATSATSALSSRRSRKGCLRAQRRNRGDDSSSRVTPFGGLRPRSRRLPFRDGVCLRRTVHGVQRMAVGRDGMNGGCSNRLITQDRQQLECFMSPVASVMSVVL